MLIIGCDGVVSLDNKSKQMDGDYHDWVNANIDFNSFKSKTHTIGQGTLCIRWALSNNNQTTDTKHDDVV